MLDRVARIPWTTLVLALVALDLVCRVVPGLAAYTVALDTVALACSLAALAPRRSPRLAPASAS